MEILDDINNHIEALSMIDVDKLREYKQILREALHNNKTVFVCGNGGSASTSAHLTGELVGKFMTERPGFKAVDLSGNNTVITAIGNDYSYQEIFSRQLTAMADSGDLLISFSTSGNSKNIIEALAVAKAKGINTINILGRDGGEIKKQGYDCLIAPGYTTPVIQIVHDFIMHQLAYVSDEVKK